MIKSSTGKRSVKPRRGLAAVEMAVLAPVLVFLTIGMLEMARGMMAKETLTDAARKGCRTAILPNAINASVTTDIGAVLASHDFISSDATIQITVNDLAADLSTATPGAKIGVKVSLPVSKVAWITPLFLPAADIESETVFMMSQK